MGREISSLRNLGKKSQQMLNEVGIEDADALRAVGAEAAYVMLRLRFDGKVSLNALWAMEGALTETDWRRIEPARKQELLDQIGGSDRKVN